MGSPLFGRRKGCVTLSLQSILRASDRHRQRSQWGNESLPPSLALQTSVGRISFRRSAANRIC